MKLRLQFNSIRLRLKRGEVSQLVKTGRVEEAIITGSGPSDILRYVLESSHAVSTPQAHLRNNGVLIQLPAESVARWSSGNEVGIEASLPVANQAPLQILVEKDFACLDGTDEKNADTYPHPLAGSKC